MKYFSMFSGNWRYMGIGIIAYILAIVFILLPFPFGIDHIVYYTWTVGTLLFLFGSIKLGLFLHNNPIVEELEEI